MNKSKMISEQSDEIELDNMKRRSRIQAKRIINNKESRDIYFNKMG